MAAQDEIVTNVRDTTGVIQSATALIDGEAARLTAAVAQALALGASEAELVPVKAVITEMLTAKTELARAVAANPGGGSAVPPVSPAEGGNPQTFRTR